MALPKYIERGGEQVFQEPFIADGVALYGFAIQADHDKLQEMCDRYLNGPMGESRRFVPAISHVVVVFNTIEVLKAKDPPDGGKGSFPESEAAVWVLVADTVTERLLWFYPYMIVDISYAMAMGREIYGFPKTMGWFDIPDGPDDAGHFEVRTWGLPRYGPEERGRRGPLITVDAVGKAPPAHHELSFTSIEHAVENIIKLLDVEPNLIDEAKLGFHALKDALNLRMPMTFLKQFRDVEKPGSACYQAIVEVDSKMTKFSSAQILNSAYDVTVEDWASHPLKSELGLSSSTVRADLSFYMAFNFEIGGGREVFHSNEAARAAGGGA